MTLAFFSQVRSVPATLIELLLNGLDDDIGYVDPSRQACQSNDDLCYVLWSKNCLSMFVANRRWTLLKDGSVDFAGIDVRDSDPFAADFVGDTSTHGTHCKFAGGVGDTTERDGTFTSYARDVDDEPAFPCPHLWQNAMDAIVGTGRVDRHHLVPLLRRHGVNRAFFDVNSRRVNQNINATKRPLDPFKKSFHATSRGNIERMPYEQVIGGLDRFRNCGFSSRSDCNLGSRLSKLISDCVPDAGRSSRDYDMFVLQLVRLKHLMLIC